MIICNNQKIVISYLMWPRIQFPTVPISSPTRGVGPQTHRPAGGPRPSPRKEDRTRNPPLRFLVVPALFLSSPPSHHSVFTKLATSPCSGRIGQQLTPRPIPGPDPNLLVFQSNYLLFLVPNHYASKKQCPATITAPHYISATTSTPSPPQVRSSSSSPFPSLLITSSSSSPPLPSTTDHRGELQVNTSGTHLNFQSGVCN